MNRKLNNLTTWLTRIFARAYATIFAILLVVLWLLGIPFLGMPDWYQLAINTTTTIVTFIMVFFVLNTQNRDNAAIQVKLDAIITSLDIDEKEFADLETLTDTELEAIQKKYQNRGRR